MEQVCPQETVTRHQGGEQFISILSAERSSKDECLKFTLMLLGFSFFLLEIALVWLLLLRWWEREAQHGETFINSGTGLSTGEKTLSNLRSNRWLEMWSWETQKGRRGGQMVSNRCREAKYCHLKGTSFSFIPTEPGALSHLQILFALLGQADGETY